MLYYTYAKLTDAWLANVCFDIQVLVNKYIYITDLRIDSHVLHALLFCIDFIVLYCLFANTNNPQCAADKRLFYTNCKTHAHAVRGWLMRLLCAPCAPNHRRHRNHAPSITYIGPPHRRCVREPSA